MTCTSAHCDSCCSLRPKKSEDLFLNLKGLKILILDEVKFQILRSRQTGNFDQFSTLFTSNYGTINFLENWICAPTTLDSTYQIKLFTDVIIISRFNAFKLTTDQS